MFELLGLLLGGDGPLDEGNIKIFDTVGSFEGFEVAEFDEFFPGGEVIVEHFGEKDGTVFTTSERKPADD